MGSRHTLARSLKPGWFMRRVMDPLTVLLVGKLGMDDHNGTRVLQLKGRRTGVWHSTPVRALELDGQRYVVAMYGESAWVRNLRAEGGGRVVFGRNVTEFRGVELAGEQKLKAYRAYLRRWWPYVREITSVASPDVSDAELAKDAFMHPVFRLEPATLPATRRA